MIVNTAFWRWRIITQIFDITNFQKYQYVENLKVFDFRKFVLLDIPQKKSSESINTFYIEYRNLYKGSWFLQDLRKDVSIGTAQKLKFSINDFFGKCDQIRSFLRTLSHLLKKLLMENFTFCAVKIYMQTTGGRFVNLQLANLTFLTF